MEQSTKVKFKIRWFIAVVFLIGIIGFTYYKLTSPSSAGAMPGGASPPPTLVEVGDVQIESWPTLVEATGNLKAIRGVDIKSEVSGRVTRVFFASGSYVKEGSPLVETNPEILRAELNQAIAQYKLAEDTYKRQQELYQKQVISLHERDQSLSDRDSSRAKVAMWKAQLNQVTIRAPFSGKVGLSRVEVGDYLQPGTDITNIQALDPLRVDFTIPEVYLSKLKVGLPLALKTAAYPNLTFNAQVYAIDAEVDSKTRSVAVRARVFNPLQQLLPGMFVQVTLQLSEGEQTLTIPAVAVTYDAEGSYVYRIASASTVQRVPVVLGERRGNEIAVREGLKQRDQIVTAGQLKLRDGAKINIKNKQ